jgi:cysteinyl-tRNA synthetase
LDLLKEETINISEEIKNLVEKREKERKNKNWLEADKLRKEIQNKGYNILDTKEGPRLEKIK